MLKFQDKGKFRYENSIIDWQNNDKNDIVEKYWKEKNLEDTILKIIE